MKNPAGMTNGQINEEARKLQAKASTMNDRMIELGFGAYRFSDLRNVDNDEVRAYLAVVDRQAVLNVEVQLRMGGTSGYVAGNLPKGGARVKQ